jgi:hypothetical protein
MAMVAVEAVRGLGGLPTDEINYLAPLHSLSRVDATSTDLDVDLELEIPEVDQIHACGLVRPRVGGWFMTSLFALLFAL